MTLSYINHVPVSAGELSIVLAESANTVMEHSCALARGIKDAGVGVLLINCGMSERRFREHSGYPEEGNPRAHYFIRSSYCGDLVGERDELQQIITECRIGVVVIAGWEFTSSTYRRKERLLYFLRELMAEQDLSIVIYSQTPTKPVVGKYDRGGIGKLATIAIEIVNAGAAKFLECASPKPPAIAIHTAEEWRAAERSAQLLTSKINNLQEQNRKKQSEDSGAIPGRLRDKEPVKSNTVIDENGKISTGISGE